VHCEAHPGVGTSFLPLSRFRYVRRCASWTLLFWSARV
jgi:hypothetical protein